MKLRRSAASLGVAAAAMAGIALAPGVANASSGGGCEVGGGIKACISASGKNVEPDMYVTSAMSGCQHIHFEVWDANTGDLKGEGDFSCSVGTHDGPFPFAGTNGHIYYVLAEEVGGSANWTYSPNLNFQD
jgi:hypothetical protein